ncbi:hypothetical protein HKCCE3408_01325 [Rhodobacterales bacterium HKCCE3408]|nr:hypothetical protein [Rhodobacterales bacterium HKCCE3408]
METQDEAIGSEAAVYGMEAGAGDGIYRTEIYGPTGEDIISARGPFGAVLGGNGDDRIFVFDTVMPGIAVGEGGADTIIFCTIGGRVSGVVLNASVVNTDSEPDTFVVGPDAFRAAQAYGPGVIDFGGRPMNIPGALIIVTGFDPRNDRIILRPPFPVDMVHQSITGFDQTITAGPIELVFSFDDPDIDPRPAVTVSQASPTDTVDRLDIDAILAARRDNSTAGPGQAGGSTGIFGGLFGDGHGEGHGDGHGDGHGGTLAAVAEAHAAATSCGEMFDATMLDAPVADPTPDYFDERESTWRDGADTLAYFGDGTPQNLMAGGGNDLIWLFNVEEGTEIIAGDGSDLVILCSVEDVAAVIWLERGDAGPDDDPDTLIIAPDVLDDVPPGFERTVSLYEFDPLIDRLILPPGPWQPTISLGGRPVSPTDNSANGTLFNADVSYGPLRVSLSLGQASNGASIYRAISVGAPDPGAQIRDLAARDSGRPTNVAEFRPVDPATWAMARTLTGNTLSGTPPQFDCAAPPQATPRPAFDTSDEHGALFVQYGDGADVIVVRSIDDDPANGVYSQSQVHFGDGVDVVYSYTSNAYLLDGPGFDTVVLCDVDGLANAVGASPDGSPDILIVDAAVFRKPVLSGFERTISIAGYGELTDYIILRLPANARIEPDLTHYRVVTPTGTTRIRLNGHDGAGPEASAQPETIIIWPE